MVNRHTHIAVCCYDFQIFFTAGCTIVQSVVLRLHVVRLSVTVVDQNHIGWKSWKLIAQTISPTPSLFVAQRPPNYSQANVGKFWGDYRWCAGAQKRQYL